SLLNLAADRGLQCYEPHFVARNVRRPRGPHHFSAGSSALPNSGQTKESSAAAAMRFAASAHRARGCRLTGASTIRSSSSDKSRSSPVSMPICERIGLGMITPEELPNFLTRARIPASSRLGNNIYSTLAAQSTNKVITQPCVWYRCFISRDSEQLAGDVLKVVEN